MSKPVFTMQTGRAPAVVVRWKSRRQPAQSFCPAPLDQDHGQLEFRHDGGSDEEWVTDITYCATDEGWL